MVARVLLRVATAAVLAFIYLPLVLIVLYAFNSAGTSAWPPTGLTLRWFTAALENSGLRDAFVTSVLIALCASAIAVVLGTLASVAVSRYRFFGRETISFVVVFPIALPGIVTGMALSTTFATVGFRSASSRSSWVMPRSASCSVYNNVIARLRRVSRSYERHPRTSVPTRS
jgi:putative spermidine/putrescine transport system permease protein